MSKHYEMAKANNPEEIILATQRSFVVMLKGVIADVRKDLDPRIPGLTWEQLDYLFDGCADKKPEIIVQEEEM